MARLVDESKIERIKQSALLMVVENGFGGASISSIAGKAGVAEGYLYRFYKSKTDLVNSLLYDIIKDIADRLEPIISGGQSVKNIFGEFITILFNFAIKRPEKIKFLYVLMNDYNFNIHEDQRQRIFLLCKELKEKGIISNEIGSGIDEEHIFLIGVVYPIQFINLRIKNFFYKSQLGDQEITEVISIILKFLK